MINVKKVGININMNSRSSAEVISQELDSSKNRVLFDVKVFIAKRKEMIKVEHEYDVMWALHQWKEHGIKPTAYATGTITLH